MTVNVADWPTLHAVGWTAHQARYGLLEARAETIRQYQNSLVPGLLQTERYATVILRDVVGVPADQLAEAVTARLARQQVLVDIPVSKYSVVVTEAVLRHHLGDAAMMAEQLQHIADALRFEPVDFAVLPIISGMRETHGPSFVLYGLPGWERLVLAETTSGELREDRPDVLDRYAREWSTYRAAAVDGAAAFDLVERIAEEMRHAASAQRREGRSAGHSQTP